MSLPVAIFSDSTLSSNGSKTVETSFSNRDVIFIINITGTPTGSTPTLQFTFEEIDPGNLTTIVGQSVTSNIFNAPTTQNVTVATTVTTAYKISWVLTGTTPSFTGVNVTVIPKEGIVNAIVQSPTGMSAAVKGPSTPAAAGDHSLVVALSPNSPIPAGANAIGSVSVTGTVTVAGNRTNNGAAPGANNIGTLSAVATAAAPTYTEGNQVALSTDLSGALRISGGGGGGTSSAFNGAFPASGTAAGFSDGSDMRHARVYDLHSAGPTEYALGVNLRVTGPSGSIEVGTSTAPLRIDPTGSTTQPVSGTVTANQGTAAAIGNAWPTQVTDGANPAAVMNTAPAGTEYGLVVRMAGGASGGTASSFGAAFPGTGTAVGFFDGTNMVSARTFDTDSGGGTQNTLGVSLRKTASGGSVELGTAADPVRTDPTGTTGQPVTDNGGSLTVDTTQLPAALVGGRLDTNVGAWLGSTAPTVGQKTSANSLPIVIASDQSAVTVSGTVTANIGTTGGLALDATLGRAQGSTTSGQTGPLIQGAVTTASPTYTTAQTNPLSLTTAGALRVDGSGVTQPVSGTVTANQGGTWTVQPGNTANTTPWRIRPSDGTNDVNVKAASTAAVAGDPSLVVALSPNSPLPSGTNTIGALTANQSVNLAQVGGTATVTGGLAGSQGVGGLAANGASAVGNPVLIGGLDGTTLRSLKVSPNGSPQTILDLNQTTVHNGAVLTGSGSSAIFSGFAGKEVGLIINCTSHPGGPDTIIWQLQQVDPVDGVTGIGSATTVLITGGVGANVGFIDAVQSGHIKVTWTLSPPGGPFTVNATLISKQSSGTVGVQSPNGNTFTTTLTQAVGSAPDGVVVAAPDSGSIVRSLRVDQKSRALLTADLFFGGAFNGILGGSPTQGPFFMPRFAEGRRTISGTTADTDVMDGAYNIVASTQAQIVSSSASDTSSKVIRLWFIRSDGAIISEDLALNGTTAVNTAATTVIFAVHMEQVSGAALVGTVTFRSTPGTVTLMQIQPGQSRAFYAQAVAPFFSSTGQRIAVMSINYGISGNSGTLFLRSFGTGLDGTSTTDPPRDLIAGLRVVPKAGNAEVLFRPPIHITRGLGVRAVFKPDSTTACTPRIGLDYVWLPAAAQ